MNKLQREQRGSALVEAAILMMTMLPLIYAVVMLGKLIDLKQTTTQAARYAAWEATVYPAAGPNGAAPLGITQRFFGSPDDAIQTQLLEAGSHPLWGVAVASSNNRFETDTRVAINQPSAAAHYQRDISEPTVAMRVGQLAGKSGEILDGLSGNSWGLSADGLVQATVELEVAGGDWVTNGEQNCGTEGSSVCLNSSAVILVDGWSSSSDSQARERVRSLMPASALEPLGDAVSIVGKLPMFGELKGLKNAFGHVDMGVLPEYAKP